MFWKQHSNNFPFSRTDRNGQCWSVVYEGKCGTVTRTVFVRRLPAQQGANMPFPTADEGRERQAARAKSQSYQEELKQQVRRRAGVEVGTERERRVSGVTKDENNQGGRRHEFSG